MCGSPRMAMPQRGSTSPEWATSDGLVEDEYAKREQDDALHIIEWLAAQRWCTGNVGMIGISWGGFNSLQVAARRPPRLKAIVTICSTDDRYACDAHYLGGCLLNDNFAWGGAFFNYAALPPDPEVVGEDRWREMWKSRIDNHVMFPGHLAQPPAPRCVLEAGLGVRGLERHRCPVFAVGGWLDGYTQTIFRLVENLKRRARAWSGPGATRSRSAAFPARRSASSRNAPAGGTNISRAKTAASTRIRPCGFGCRIMCRPKPPIFSKAA